MVMALLVAAAPNLQGFSAFDAIGPAATLAFVLITGAFLLYKRIIVMGSTCELLLKNERERAELAEAAKDAANQDVKRLAEDMNQTIRLILTSVYSQKVTK